MAVLVPAIFRLMQKKRGFERGVRFISEKRRGGLAVLSVIQIH